MSPSTNGASSTLSSLAAKHGTDKRNHGYIPYYDQLFSPIRTTRLTLLEIGVGGHKNEDEGGDSLRMWRDYFPNAMIYGIDIEDKRKFEGDRIHIFRGDQNDTSFLAHVAETIGDIDIAIDDGSHISEHIITSFRTLFEYLKIGGIYAIEDLHCSYWPQLGGDWRDLNGSNTSVAMLKQLVDGLNYQYIPTREPSCFDEHVTSVHFYPKIAFVFKGNNYVTLPPATRRWIGKAASWYDTPSNDVNGSTQWTTVT